MKILINKKIINTLNLNHINVDNKSIYLRFWNKQAEIESYSWFKNSTLFQRLFEKLARKTFSNHKEVFGEAFFKKLRRTPPF
ncbi:hypothetical protein S101446_01121 [Komagataeibacter europaeus]|nr:hypothetical protein S101446_01121 [Komagataeibacter europaeus]